mmetsp:Transcript_7112/g.20160  ORF Transcript_7112/g.20160 Transcript_7112/m.20160 type:complete len:430 (+) Transcript_7112:71-1360(+)
MVQRAPAVPGQQQRYLLGGARGLLRQLLLLRRRRLGEHPLAGRQLPLLGALETVEGFLGRPGGRGACTLETGDLRHLHCQPARRALPRKRRRPPRLLARGLLDRGCLAHGDRGPSGRREIGLACAACILRRLVQHHRPRLGGRRGGPGRRGGGGRGDERDDDAGEPRPGRRLDRFRGWHHPGAEELQLAPGAGGRGRPPLPAGHVSRRRLYAGGGRDGGAGRADRVVARVGASRRHVRRRSRAHGIGRRRQPGRAPGWLRQPRQRRVAPASHGDRGRLVCEPLGRPLHRRPRLPAAPPAKRAHERTGQAQLGGHRRGRGPALLQQAGELLHQGCPGAPGSVPTPPPRHAGLRPLRPTSRREAGPPERQESHRAARRGADSDDHEFRYREFHGDLRVLGHAQPAVHPRALLVRDDPHRGTVRRRRCRNPG